MKYDDADIHFDLCMVYGERGPWCECAGLRLRGATDTVNPASASALYACASTSVLTTTVTTAPRDVVRLVGLVVTIVVGHVVLGEARGATRLAEVQVIIWAHNGG